MGEIRNRGASPGSAARRSRSPINSTSVPPAAPGGGQTDAELPAVQGLYDPALGKGSCGVGFIADIKGRKSHKIVEDALSILCNLEHRGAVGADPRAGDGAGILVQIPHAFFSAAAEKNGFRLPAPGEYAVGALFMPRDPDWRQVIRDIYAEVVKREGMTLLGWRDVPIDNSTLGESVKPTEPVHQQVFIGRGKKIQDETEFERRLYILRRSMSNVIYQRRERRLAGYYPVSISCRTIIYKGMFLADQLGTYYPDLRDPRIRKRARARAPALLHQYVPGLVAGASLPDGGAQRRDQYAARQSQLDGGAAGLGHLAALRRGDQQALADLLRGPVRHRLLRQRARVSGAGRLWARPRHDDAHSGSLGRQPADGRGTARLLRIQCRPDGALGRPRRHRVHQWTADRRHARPQRSASGPLFRHPRRPHHHGLRDGRAADSGEGHRHQVAAAARQDAAGRSRRGPPHSRRGAQGDAVAAPSLQAVARSQPDRARGFARGGARGGAFQPRAARSPAGLRLHPGRSPES